MLGSSPSECKTMDRIQPSEGQGTGMVACEQAAAAAAARAIPRAGGGHVEQREEHAGWRGGRSPREWTAAGRRWPRGAAGRACRLAKREKPQRVHDHGQEVATPGSGERDAGLRCGSNASQCMTAGRNGHLWEREERWRLASREQPQRGSGIGHLRVSELRCRLAKRARPQ